MGSHHNTATIRARADTALPRSRAAKRPAKGEIEYTDSSMQREASPLRGSSIQSCDAAAG